MNAVVPLTSAKRQRRQADADRDRRGPPDSRHGLPIIKVVASEMPRVVDEAEDVLLEAGVPIFARAGTLVHPVTETMPAAGGRLTRVARLKQLSPDALTDILAREAKFQRYDDRRRQWVNVDPPAKVAATLLAREGRWRLPPVAGVITTPTLRPDGTILAEAGYDAATRLYLMLDEDLVLPEISERPTKAEAHRALELLNQVLVGFPFVGGVDRAVALSGILTAVVRPALPVAPAHAIRASTAGTGKSYLVDLFSVIATGRPCAVMAVGKTEEETDKRLGALLLDGAPVISLDNVNGELGGDTLCQMTERPVVRVRILGRSEVPEIECRATVFATGNNLTLVGDMTRRALLSTLDAGAEQPELRQFDSDPIAEVLRDRGAYVAAAITIVRAFRASGAARCPQLASYGAWSNTVRSALVWLGEEDPVASLNAARSEDPVRMGIAELYTAWREHLVEGALYTTPELAAAAADVDMEGQFFRPSLRDAFMRQAAKGPMISTRSLGRWLTSIRGRVVNGFRLDMEPDEKRGNRYALHRVGSDREAAE